MDVDERPGPQGEGDVAGEERPFLRGLRRGFVRRCPNCGEGALFRGYLRVRETCPSCGHDNERYPADDAPPYFTILITGHLVVAPSLALGVIQTWPTWLSMTVFPTLILIFTLVFLPFVKGAVIGAEWSLGITDPQR